MRDTRLDAARSTLSHICQTIPVCILFPYLRSSLPIIRLRNGSACLSQSQWGRTSPVGRSSLPPYHDSAGLAHNASLTPSLRGRADRQPEGPGRTSKKGAGEFFLACLGGSGVSVGHMPQSNWPRTSGDALEVSYKNRMHSMICMYMHTRGCVDQCHHHHHHRMHMHTLSYEIIKKILNHQSAQLQATGNDKVNVSGHPDWLADATSSCATYVLHNETVRRVDLDRPHQSRMGKTLGSKRR